jgi:hypothetical protein
MRFGILQNFALFCTDPLENSSPIHRHVLCRERQAEWKGERHGERNWGRINEGPRQTLE